MFTVEETIDATPQEVWRHFADAGLMDGWMPGIEGMRTRDGGAVAAGKTLMFRSRGASRTATVAEFRPPHLVTLRSRQGPITATYRYSIAGKDKPTRVTLNADCTAQGPAVFVAPIIRILMRRADSGQLKALKAAVETASAV